METAKIDCFHEKRPVIISGPCSAESEEQLLKTCSELSESKKVDVLRAGIWKPRTRPNSFEGVGLKGLGWLKKAKEQTGLPISVEVANSNHVYEALKHDIDILWIGARTTVSPFSVQEIADALNGTDSTVLVKNPVNPDVELWTGALERLSQSGIKKLGMIHRGFAGYGKSMFRNEPQWQLPLEMKRRFPEIPMICDPSHICGNRSHLQEVAQRSLDLNYEGLMIETHINPEVALSDKKQQLTPTRLIELLESLVVRKTSADGNGSYAQLDFLRQEINSIDNELIRLLGSRMKVAEEIGRLKKDENLIILQSNRWEEIMDKVVFLGTQNGLSKKFMTRYLRAVHQESIDHQNIVMNDLIEHF